MMLSDDPFHGIQSKSRPLAYSLSRKEWFVNVRHDFG